MKKNKNYVVQDDTTYITVPWPEAHGKEFSFSSENGFFKLYNDSLINVMILHVGSGIDFGMFEDVYTVTVSMPAGQMPVGTYTWELFLQGDESTKLEASGELEIVKQYSARKKRSVKPWDLFNPSMPKASEEERDRRLAICHDCPMLVMGICQSCGCVMKFKTSLQDAECPLHKW